MESEFSGRMGRLRCRLDREVFASSKEAREQVFAFSKERVNLCCEEIKVHLVRWH